MTVRDYYNDNDPGAAEWLRELIRAGEIPEGDVDERSILDIRPSDLAGYRRVHFFAGIGGWAEALRLAEWPDDVPVWTGSPPCQPLSVAGKRLGRDDPRHLAPHFCSLVRAARPGLLFGEQVASADVFGKTAKPSRSNTGNPPQWAWIDDLSDRLEAARYAVGANDFPSAGVGAPHIRQRTLFGAASHEWLADSDSLGWIGRWSVGAGRRDEPANIRSDGRLVHGQLSAPERQRQHGWQGLREQEAARPAGRCLADRLEPAGSDAGVLRGGAVGGVGNAIMPRRQPESNGRGSYGSGMEQAGRVSEQLGQAGIHTNPEPPAGPTNGFWSDSDWLLCRDGKWRPAQSSIFPLAHGVQGRVGMLRGAGNAINPHAAAQFIRAFREALEDVRMAA